MPRCPHCSYSLVLLLHRLKYKCAKCSRLRSQKLIEMKEFREWNQWQRDVDWQNLKADVQTKKKSAEERKALRALRLLFRNKRETLPSEERRVKILAHKEAYYQKNKELLYQKETFRRQSNLVLHNQRKIAWRNRSLTAMRTYGMIQYWRKKQSALALQFLENSGYSTEETKSRQVLPTNLLAQLLSTSR